MYRNHDSLRHQRADAGQRITEDSEELHKAETACVSEQCQARTSQLDGTLTQNAWQTTLLVIKSHVKGFWTKTANVMNRGAMFPPTAGKQASHISDTKGRM